MANTTSLVGEHQRSRRAVPVLRPSHHRTAAASCAVAFTLRHGADNSLRARHHLPPRLLAKQRRQSQPRRDRTPRDPVAATRQHRVHRLLFGQRRDRRVDNDKHRARRSVMTHETDQERGVNRQAASQPRRRGSPVAVAPSHQSTKPLRSTSR